MFDRIIVKWNFHNFACITFAKDALKPPENIDIPTYPNWKTHIQSINVRANVVIAGLGLSWDALKISPAFVSVIKPIWNDESQQQKRIYL